MIHLLAPNRLVVSLIVVMLFAMPMAGWPIATVQQDAPAWAVKELESAKDVDLTSAGWITETDEWEILASRLTLTPTEDGGITRHYRQVFRPLTDEPEALTISIDFNSEVERLIEPRVWRVLRGGRAGRPVAVKRKALDAPNLSQERGSTNRKLIFSIPLASSRDHISVEWSIVAHTLPTGSTIVAPNSQWPVREFTITSADPSILPLTLLLTDGAQQPVDGASATFREIPRQELMVAQGSWSPSHAAITNRVMARLSTIPAPTALAHQLREAMRSNATNEIDLSSLVDQLAPATLEPNDRIATLVGFVQRLANRKHRWDARRWSTTPLSQILRTRAANSTGKANLLVEMLAHGGIAAHPVLINADTPFQPPIEPYLLEAFDRMIVAIDPGSEASLPGQLTSGPGTDWVLFDPSDPLAAFGQPMSGLTSRQALWLGPEPDDFSVQTKADEQPLKLTLSMSVGGNGEGQFKLIAEGDSVAASIWVPVLPATQLDEVPDALRDGLQEFLRSAVKGLTIESVAVSPPNHRQHRPARIEIQGYVPDALQTLTPELELMRAPIALLGALVQLPEIEQRFAVGSAADAVTEPEHWNAGPCCMGRSSRVQASIRIELPDGWAVAGYPEPVDLRRRWVSASSVDHANGWDVKVHWLRGNFGVNAASSRLGDLNIVSRAFRQALIVARPATAGTRPEKLTE